ncbi:MAG: OmpA family protein [Casimicrobiaceae bacterium]|nr:OmpA family protein [Casimicrobiaceae bacterium]MDW8311798.1 OmpA family protein [Burkholderiales bacterium]
MPAVRLPIAQTDRGVQFVLPDALLFEFGKAELDLKQSGPYLDRLAELLKTKTDKTVSVEGHTDNIGSQAANQALSERRAAAVAQALVQRGVPAARITQQGFSFTRPVAPNDLEAGRRLNRRTEVIVLGERIERFLEGEPPGAFEDAAARVREALEGRARN